jgi:hypothetical protein
MSTNLFSKSLIAGAAFATLAVVGLVIGSPSSSGAKNDNNGAQDEKQMIQIGLAIAPVPLNMDGKDQDMVGLGSYVVNVTGDCNGCHSAGPASEYVLPNNNPYIRQPPYDGTAVVNQNTYLGGGRDFGIFPPGMIPPAQLHIISRNLTPDKSGLPEGGRPLSQFMQIMRTGVDLDQAHPNCPGNVPGPSCMLAPFDGSKLQIMRWPSFHNMTDRQLTAIYTYLSAIPCLEGGPGEPSPRCQ